MSKWQKPPLKGVIDFFFEGSLAGWVGGGEYAESPPGVHLFQFRKGGFLYTDTYYTFPGSDRSFGDTIIEYDRRVIWGMYYGGEYPKSATPLLKEALRQAYAKGDFCGGRGPSCYSPPGPFVYRNEVRPLSTHPLFLHFSGEERVLDRKSEESIGHHLYWGMAIA